MTHPPALPLSDGNWIPQMAFGSGSVNKGEDTSDNINQAIELGFNHIDTAQAYANEEYVGKSIKQSPLSRSELFVTTKYSTFIEKDTPLGALKKSLSKLGTDYVDLYLIHAPNQLPDIAAGWKEFEAAREQGLARSIGVSNFNVDQLKQLVESSLVKPAVNQIELHPYNILAQTPLLTYCAQNNILIEAYRSLYSLKNPGGGGGPLDTVVNKLAKERDVSPGQILFLWVLGKGAVVVTTSSKKERMQEYLDTFDLSPLTWAEIAAIDTAGAARAAGTLAPLQAPPTLPLLQPPQLPLTQPQSESQSQSQFKSVTDITPSTPTPSTLEKGGLTSTSAHDPSSHVNSNFGGIKLKLKRVNKPTARDHVVQCAVLLLFTSVVFVGFKLFC